MEFLQFDSSESFSKNGPKSRKKNSTNFCVEEFSFNPGKQRSQANARERDRTHRFVLFLN